MLSKLRIRTILTCVAIGFFALGPPCAGAQEEENQSPQSAESAQPESTPDAPPEAVPEAQSTGEPEAPAPTEEAEGPRPLEEIVVTARKVTESIQERAALGGRAGRRRR